MFPRVCSVKDEMDHDRECPIISLMYSVLSHDVGSVPMLLVDFKMVLQS